jgi:CheY-like chemotaxis protein
VKPRVLIVEDNPINCELLRDWLEAYGCEVETAENLGQAYTALAGEPPSLVLLDVQLGSEDGLTLSRWIREQPRLYGLVVIAVTAHAMVADHQRVLEAGCNACTSKPIDFARFREQLQRLLVTESVDPS